MKILAIDSSSLVASIAIVEDDKLLGEYTINYKKTHSQTLLPMIDEVARMIELDLNTLDYIAVSAGPGSFTGLRIGSATAKGLGLALGKDIISVPTVDALAYNMWGTDMQICPLMDARRQQAYTGLYAFTTEGALQVLEKQDIIEIPEIIDRVNASGRKTVFVGDGINGFRPYIEEHCKVEYCFAPALSNQNRASSVACLGMVMAKNGQIEKAADHKPDYLKPSQAEREHEEKARDFTI